MNARGAESASHNQDISMSRGLRNNNPLNIRHGGDTWLGEVKPSRDTSFKTFEAMPWGYRAAFKLLTNYARYHGCETLDDFISRWAPPFENNTRGYIRTVAKRSGLEDISRVDVSNREMMTRIVAAMSFVENGVEADMAEVAEGWDLYQRHP